jgi:hypothetical protein
MWTVQVCLHEFRGGGKEGGKCVKATVKFTPSHSTRFEYISCEDSKDRSCKAAWQVVEGDEPMRWASGLGLPADKGWAETYNEQISVDVNLRESRGRDVTVLAVGICTTAFVLAAVLGCRALHTRYKID